MQTLNRSSELGRTRRIARSLSLSIPFVLLSVDVVVVVVFFLSICPIFYCYSIDNLAWAHVHRWFDGPTENETNQTKNYLFIYLYFIFRSIHFNWMELIFCVSYVHRVSHICVSHRYSRHINLYIYVICDKYLCAIKWFASRDHQQRRRQQRIVWHWEIIRARTHSLFHTYTHP